MNTNTTLLQEIARKMDKLATLYTPPAPLDIDARAREILAMDVENLTAEQVTKAREFLAAREASERRNLRKVRTNGFILALKAWVVWAVIVAIFGGALMLLAW